MEKQQAIDLIRNVLQTSLYITLNGRPATMKIATKEQVDKGHPDLVFIEDDETGMGAFWDWSGVYHVLTNDNGVFKTYSGELGEVIEDLDAGLVYQYKREQKKVVDIKRAHLSYQQGLKGLSLDDQLNDYVKYMVDTHNHKLVCGLLQSLFEAFVD